MLPDEVREAVEYVDQIFDDADNGEWAAIKAHLLAREAEVERLNAAWDSSFKQAMQNGQAAQEQRDRAERAEALLRSCNAACNRVIDQDGGILGGIDFSALGAAITAHLSENSRGNS